MAAFERMEGGHLLSSMGPQDVSTEDEVDEEDRPFIISLDDSDGCHLDLLDELDGNLNNKTDHISQSVAPSEGSRPTEEPPPTFSNVPLDLTTRSSRVLTAATDFFERNYQDSDSVKVSKHPRVSGSTLLTNMLMNDQARDSPGSCSVPSNVIQGSNGVFGQYESARNETRPGSAGDKSLELVSSCIPTSTFKSNQFETVELDTEGTGPWTEAVFLSTNDGVSDGSIVQAPQPMSVPRLAGPFPKRASGTSPVKQGQAAFGHMKLPHITPSCSKKIVGQVPWTRKEGCSCIMCYTGRGLAEDEPVLSPSELVLIKERTERKRKSTGGKRVSPKRQAVSGEKNESVHRKEVSSPSVHVATPPVLFSPSCVQRSSGIHNQILTTAASSLLTSVVQAVSPGQSALPSQSLLNSMKMNSILLEVPNKSNTLLDQYVNINNQQVKVIISPPERVVSTVRTMESVNSRTTQASPHGSASKTTLAAAKPVSNKVFLQPTASCDSIQTNQSNKSNTPSLLYVSSSEQAVPHEDIHSISVLPNLNIHRGSSHSNASSSSHNNASSSYTLSRSAATVQYPGVQVVTSTNNTVLPKVVQSQRSTPVAVVSPAVTNSIVSAVQVRPGDISGSNLIHGTQAVNLLKCVEKVDVSKPGQVILIVQTPQTPGNIPAPSQQTCAKGQRSLITLSQPIVVSNSVQTISQGGNQYSQSRIMKENEMTSTLLSVINSHLQKSPNIAQANSVPVSSHHHTTTSSSGVDMQSLIAGSHKVSPPPPYSEAIRYLNPASQVSRSGICSTSTTSSHNSQAQEHLNNHLSILRQSTLELSHESALEQEIKSVDHSFKMNVLEKRARTETESVQSAPSEERLTLVLPRPADSHAELDQNKSAPFNHSQTVSHETDLPETSRETGSISPQGGESPIDSPTYSSQSSALWNSWDKSHRRPGTPSSSLIETDKGIKLRINFNDKMRRKSKKKALRQSRSHKRSHKVIERSSKPRDESNHHHKEDMMAWEQKVVEPVATDENQMPLSRTENHQFSGQVETAEEMFQRFEEQAQQEVFKAQLGVGQLSRSLRPGRQSYIDRLPLTFAGSQKVRPGETEKKNTQTKKVENAQCATNVKKTLVASKPSVSQVKEPTINDFPRFRQDRSISNRKKLFCPNIRAGHEVHVSFNVFTNLNSGRTFLLPFFNIGGTRTQFDVEDMEYACKAMPHFEREERTCARHLLYYSRENKKATFLRKEKFQLGEVTEKSYEKVCFDIEGFKRQAPKRKLEESPELWKVDNKVSIEIDCAEIDPGSEGVVGSIVHKQFPVNGVTTSASVDATLVTDSSCARCRSNTSVKNSWGSDRINASNEEQTCVPSSRPTEPKVAAEQSSNIPPLNSEPDCSANDSNEQPAYTKRLQELLRSGEIEGSVPEQLLPLHNECTNSPEEAEPMDPFIPHIKLEKPDDGYEASLQPPPVPSPTRSFDSALDNHQTEDLPVSHNHFNLSTVVKEEPVDDFGDSESHSAHASLQSLEKLACVQGNNESKLVASVTACESTSTVLSDQQASIKSLSPDVSTLDVAKTIQSPNTVSDAHIGKQNDSVALDERKVDTVPESITSKAHPDSHIGLLSTQKTTDLTTCESEDVGVSACSTEEGEELKQVSETVSQKTNNEDSEKEGSDVDNTSDFKTSSEDASSSEEDDETHAEPLSEDVETFPSLSVPPNGPSKITSLVESLKQRLTQSTAPVWSPWDIGNSGTPTELPTKKKKKKLSKCDVDDTSTVQADTVLNDAQGSDKADDIGGAKDTNAEKNNDETENVDTAKVISDGILNQDQKPCYSVTKDVENETEDNDKMKLCGKTSSREAIMKKLRLKVSQATTSSGLATSPVTAALTNISDHPEASIGTCCQPIPTSESSDNQSSEVHSAQVSQSSVLITNSLSSSDVYSPKSNMLSAPCAATDDHVSSNPHQTIKVEQSKGPLQRTSLGFTSSSHPSTMSSSVGSKTTPPTMRLPIIRPQGSSEDGAKTSASSNLSQPLQSETDTCSTVLSTIKEDGKFIPIGHNGAVSDNTPNYSSILKSMMEREASSNNSVQDNEIQHFGSNSDASIIGSLSSNCDDEITIDLEDDISDGGNSSSFRSEIPTRIMQQSADIDASSGKSSPCSDIDIGTDDLPETLLSFAPIRPLVPDETPAPKPVKLRPVKRKGARDPDAKTYETAKISELGILTFDASQIEVPSESSSVTSYLSKKFSKIKGPRLMCNRRKTQVTDKVVSSNSGVAQESPRKTMILDPATSDNVVDQPQNPSLKEIFGLPETHLPTTPLQDKTHEASQAVPSKTEKRRKTIGTLGGESSTSQCLNNKRRQTTDGTKSAPSLSVDSSVTNAEVKQPEVATTGAAPSQSQVARKGTGGQRRRGTESQASLTWRQISKLRKHTTATKIVIKEEEPSNATDVHVIPETKPCKVLLERLENMKFDYVGSLSAGVVTLMKPVHIKEELPDPSDEARTSSSNAPLTVTSQTNKKILKKKKKKPLKLPKRHGPRQKKDIVDYYTSMLESLQKKAQLLEEEGERKEKEELVKKEKEEEELAEKRKKCEEAEEPAQKTKEEEEPLKETNDGESSKNENCAEEEKQKDEHIMEVVENDEGDKDWAIKKAEEKESPKEEQKGEEISKKKREEQGVDRENENLEESIKEKEGNLEESVEQKQSEMESKESQMEEKREEPAKVKEDEESEECKENSEEQGLLEPDYSKLETDADQVIDSSVSDTSGVSEHDKNREKTHSSVDKDIDEESSNRTELDDCIEVGKSVESDEIGDVSTIKDPVRIQSGFGVPNLMPNSEHHESTGAKTDSQSSNSPTSDLHLDNEKSLFRGRFEKKDKMLSCDPAGLGDFGTSEQSGPSLEEALGLEVDFEEEDIGMIPEEEVELLLGLDLQQGSSTSEQKRPSDNSQEPDKPSLMDDSLTDLIFQGCTREVDSLLAHGQRSSSGDEQRRGVDEMSKSNHKLHSSSALEQQSHGSTLGQYSQGKTTGSLLAEASAMLSKDSHNLLDGAEALMSTDLGFSPASSPSHSLVIALDHEEEDVMPEPDIDDGFGHIDNFVDGLIENEKSDTSHQKLVFSVEEGNSIGSSDTPEVAHLDLDSLSCTEPLGQSLEKNDVTPKTPPSGRTKKSTERSPSWKRLLGSPAFKELQRECKNNVMSKSKEQKEQCEGKKDSPTNFTNFKLKLTPGSASRAILLSNKMQNIFGCESGSDDDANEEDEQVLKDSDSGVKEKPKTTQASDRLTRSKPAVKPPCNEKQKEGKSPFVIPKLNVNLTSITATSIHQAKTLLTKNKKVEKELDPPLGIKDFTNYNKQMQEDLDFYFNKAGTNKDKLVSISNQESDPEKRSLRRPKKEPSPSSKSKSTSDRVSELSTATMNTMKNLSQPKKSSVARRIRQTKSTQLVEEDSSQLNITRSHTNRPQAMPPINPGKADLSDDANDTSVLSKMETLITSMSSTQQTDVVAELPSSSPKESNGKKKEDEPKRIDLSKLKMKLNPTFSKNLLKTKQDSSDQDGKSSDHTSKDEMSSSSESTSSPQPKESKPLKVPTFNLQNFKLPPQMSTVNSSPKENLTRSEPCEKSLKSPAGSSNLDPEPKKQMPVLNTMKLSNILQGLKESTTAKSSSQKSRKGHEESEKGGRSVRSRTRGGKKNSTSDGSGTKAATNVVAKGQSSSDSVNSVLSSSSSSSSAKLEDTPRLEDKAEEKGERSFFDCLHGLPADSWQQDG